MSGRVLFAQQLNKNETDRKEKEQTKRDLPGESTRISMGGRVRKRDVHCASPGSAYSDKTCDILAGGNLFEW